MRVEKLRGLFLLSTLCLLLAACETSNLGLDTDDSNKALPELAKDTTPPKIVSYLPENEAEEVEVDQTIRITFDELVEFDDTGEDVLTAGNFKLFSGRDTDDEEAILSERPVRVEFKVQDGVTVDPVTGLDVFALDSFVEMQPPSGRFALDTSYTFSISIPTEKEFNKTPEQRAEDEERNEQTIPDSDDSDDASSEDNADSRYDETSHYFTVESGEWDSAIPVHFFDAEGELEGDVMDIVAASNPVGDVIAAWRQSVNGVAQQFVARYLPNDGVGEWASVGLPSVSTNVTRLSTIGDTPVFGSRLAVSANGHIAVSWYQAIAPGQIDSVWLRVFNGSEWTAPIQIGSTDVPSNSPDLAFDASGDLHVIWRQLHAGFYRVFSSIYSPSAQLSPAVQVSGPEAGDAFMPLVKTGDPGSVRVFWTHAVDQGARRLFSRLFISGSRLPIEPVDVGNSGSVGSFSVVLGASNEGMIVWDQLDGRRSNLWSRRLLGGGMGTIESRESESTGDALTSSMVMDSEGSIVLVWNQVIADSIFLWESVYKKDTGWSVGSSMDIEVNRADPINMSVDHEGHTTVLWTSGQGRLSSVSAKRKLKLTGWGDSSVISFDDSNGSSGLLSGLPVLTQIKEDGRVLVLWSQYDGNPELAIADRRYRMMMTRYDAKSLLNR